MEDLCFDPNAIILASGVLAALVRSHLLQCNSAQLQESYLPFGLCTGTWFVGQHFQVSAARTDPCGRRVGCRTAPL